MEIWSTLLVAIVAATALVISAGVRKIPKWLRAVAVALSATVLGVALVVLGVAFLHPHNEVAMSSCITYTAEGVYANLSDEDAEVRAKHDCEEQEAKDPQLFTAVWVS